MTTLQTTAFPEFDEAPVPRRWSSEEYLELAELGYFDGQRVELIDGEILNMSPIRNAHAAAVSRLTALLSALPANRYWVRVQATLSLNGSFPDPDIAVVAGPVTSQGDYPTSALLVIEVSDSTLRLDRGKKAAIYAAAGIPEYWIVNIQAQQVEVHTLPLADASDLAKSRYGQISVRSMAESVFPLFAESLVMSVHAIFS